jgi:hypothetical protein
MVDHPIEIAGILIPSSARVFVALVAVHAAAGIVCVVAGLTAALSRKGRGRHSRAGLVYYRSLILVSATMAILAVLRSPEDNVLLMLGCLSFVAAFLARRFVGGQSPWRVRGHLIGMGSSFTLLLVAFYVDNGRQLPLWKTLPSTSYWLVPSVAGLGLITRSFFRHPLVRAESEQGRRAKSRRPSEP